MNCDYYNNIYLIENFGNKSRSIGNKCKKNSDCASSFCSVNGKCALHSSSAAKKKEDDKKQQQKSEHFKII